MRLVKNLIVIFVLACLLSSCAGITSQIGSSPLLCCPGDYQNYSEYGLRTEGLPLFLRDYVVAEFERVFDEKGLSKNDQAHDLEVMLAYNHINLYPDQQDIDPFVRMKSLNVELSYIAQIDIEIAAIEAVSSRNNTNPSSILIISLILSPMFSLLRLVNSLLFFNSKK